MLNESKAVELKEIAPWVAIIVSLGWNLVNSINARQQRKRANELSEFRSLKSPVDAILVSLRSTKEKVRALEVAGATGDDFTTEVTSLNKLISEQFNELVVSLEALDNSQFSNRGNWVEQANADWDQLMEAYERLYAPKTIEARNPVIKDVVKRFTSLIDGVQKSLENEFQQKSS